MEKINVQEKVVRGKEEVFEKIDAWADSAEKTLYLDNTKKGMLDAIQEKVISRKLLVFITATVLMWFGLDPETWGLIAMMYIGGQSAIDMVKTWKYGG